MVLREEMWKMNKKWLWMVHIELMIDIEVLVVFKFDETTVDI
jgi:hypothetical protein